MSETERVDCLNCGGTGKIGLPTKVEGGIDVNGGGRVSCAKCGGTGEVPLSEKTVTKIESLVRIYPTVEQLMETGEFESANIVHAALRVLQRRRKVTAGELFGRD